MMRATTSPSLANSLLGVVAFILVVSALREAQSVVVPVLVALFVSVVAAPVVSQLRDRGLPWGLGVFVVVSGLLAAMLALGTLAGSSLQEFSSRLPVYEEQLVDRLESLGDFGGTWTQLMARDLTSLVDPGQAMTLVASLLGSLSQLLGDSVLLILLILFMLFDIPSLTARMHAALPGADDAVDYAAKVADGLKTYLWLKTLISFLTGACAALLVWAVGVDFPLLWGLLAFVLNFVPNVGSVLAAIPPVALALVQFGPAAAGLVALGYLVINMLFGNVVEPRLTGRGVGLSTLVVFLSLVFWGWVFGPIGMLLSVPLTMAIKIALESSPSTGWLAVIMGPEAPD